MKYNPIELLAESLRENKRIRGLYEARWTVYHSILAIELFIVIIQQFVMLIIMAVK